MPNNLTLENLSYNSMLSSQSSFDDSWRYPLSILLGIGLASGADFIEFFYKEGIT